MVVLREYQKEAVERAKSAICKCENGLIVLPTGAGKSHVLAALACWAVQTGGRVLVLTHRKEILEQNINAITASGFEVGVNSAGLKKRDFDQPIICAGIQSVYQNAIRLAPRHLVIIDEAHLLNNQQEGMYARLIECMRENSRHTIIVGLTATPYRLSQGQLIDGEWFDTIYYAARLRELIPEYLCELRSIPAENEIDSSGLPRIGGEFASGPSGEFFGQTLEASCREALSKMAQRHTVLFFAASVQHAENICAYLQGIGGDDCAAMVEGNTPAEERAQILWRFGCPPKHPSKLRFLVNRDICTTGLDVPLIDGIVLMRATASPGLFAQMTGRGLRKSPYKTDCLVLDYGENIRRHGPLDSPTFGVSCKQATRDHEDAGEPRIRDGVKLCPDCEEPMARNEIECPYCGREMMRLTPEAKVKQKAESEIAILREAETILREQQRDALENPDFLTVTGMDIMPHVAKKSGKRILRIIYDTVDAKGEFEGVTEWKCPGYPGFAGRQFEKWLNMIANRNALMQFYEQQPDLDLTDFLVDCFREGLFRCPSHIVVHQKEGKPFPEIANYKFDATRPQVDFNVLEGMLKKYDATEF